MEEFRRTFVQRWVQALYFVVGFVLVVALGVLVPTFLTSLWYTEGRTVLATCFFVAWMITLLTTLVAALDVF